MICETASIYVSDTLHVKTLLPFHLYDEGLNASKDCLLTLGCAEIKMPGGIEKKWTSVI